MILTDSSLNKTASVAFALACCFSTIQSGSTEPALVAALCSLVVLNSERLKIPMNSMRVNACAMWVVGSVILTVNGFTPPSIVAATSTFIFGAGNFLSARNNDNQILIDPSIRSLKKVFNHPATFYSLGYVCTALLASRITTGASNIFAIFSMSVDIAMTTLSFFGLITNKFTNPAASFMALVVSSVFGILASLFSGNLWGVINKFCSGIGELALAYKANKAYMKAPQPYASLIHRSFSENFFKLASDLLVWPLKMIREKIE